MTTIHSNSLPVSSFQKLGMTVSARKATDEEIAKFQKTIEAAYAEPANLDDLKNHVSQKVYAEVKVNGQTVATLYNSGGAMSSNATGAAIQDLPSMGEGETSTGPELAQKRADEIAKALGGTVVKSKDAVTQAQYMAVPAFKPEYKINYDAMERDRLRAEGRVATPQTQVSTQIIGQSGDISNSATDLKEAAGKSAKEEFLEFTGKSWEEKIRAMILKSMGLEEEDLAAMSTEEREKIEAKIEETIKAEIEKKTGIIPARA